MYRRLACWVVALTVTAGFCAAASAQEKGALALVRGPYVQCVGPESAYIVWRTPGPVRPVVKYGLRPDQLDRSVGPDAIKANDKLQKGVGGMAAEDVLAEGTVQYEAQLAGLRPLTTYYYAVFDGEALLAGGDETYRLRTEPPLGRAAPVRFAAFGDSHGAGWHKTGVEKSLDALCAKEKRPVDFYLQLGDLTSKGRNVEYHYLFEPADLFRRRIVLWPTLGNHDIVAAEGATITGAYCDAFVLPTRGEMGGAPSGTEAYYSFNFGRAHFIALASFHVSRAPDGAMARWLQADLAKAKADGLSDWIVVFLHSPPITRTGSANKSDRDLDQAEERMFLLPLLEAGGVDLMLSGHLHVYERTMLVDGLYMAPVVAEGHVFDDGDGDPVGDGPYRKSAGLNPHEGTVAVICGTGGGPGQEGFHPVAKRSSLDGGMLVVDVEGDTMTCRMMRSDGAIGDKFSIVKRGKVTPRPVAQPRALPGWYYRRKLPGTRFALLPLLQEKCILNGVLDDAAWQKAQRFKFTALSDGYVFAASDGLYLGADFDSGRPPSARETQRDGPLMALDHTLELYVDPGHYGKDVYLFTTNSAGAKCDAKDGDSSYNPEWEVKVVSGVGLKNEHWIAEAHIPWRAIGLDRPPDAQSLVGLNLVASRLGTGGEWFAGRGDPRFVGLQRPAQFGYVQVGTGRCEAVIPPYDPWRYLAGQDAPAGWSDAAFDDALWKSGAAGFGYGDIENGTPLLDMKGKYSRVYARHAFEVKDAKAVRDLALIISYDDAFIAYLNGQEVLRVGVGEGRGAGAQRIAVHEGGGPEYPPDQPINRYTPLEGLPLSAEYFSLGAHVGLLRDGANVLALEGHNAALRSKAFTLDPQLNCLYRQ